MRVEAKFTDFAKGTTRTVVREISVAEVAKRNPFLSSMLAKKPKRS